VLNLKLINLKTLINQESKLKSGYLHDCGQHEHVGKLFVQIHQITELFDEKEDVQIDGLLRVD